MLELILNNIKKLEKQSSSPLLIAIDGRCGAGKTTLAHLLEKELNCAVIHLDDFFLQPFQRTDERLQEIGGNFDYERFEREVLQAFQANQLIRYRPFDCKTQSFGNQIEISSSNITIIEGSYCCHPKFSNFYDFKIFMSVEENEQLNRIRVRNGDANLIHFIEKWIPREEIYFKTYQIEDQCQITWIT